MKKVLVVVLVAVAVLVAIQLFLGVDVSSITPTSGNDIPSEWHSP